jgi:hypothetical protein
MSELTMPRHSDGRMARAYHRAFIVSAKASRLAGKAAKKAKAKARPAVAHVSDHIFTIVSFGLIDSAMFVHSLFTGLIVTGVSFAVFEWKVSKPDA